jgi:hypothetical protein
MAALAIQSSGDDDCIMNPMSLAFGPLAFNRNSCRLTFFVFLHSHSISTDPIHDFFGSEGLLFTPTVLTGLATPRVSTKNRRQDNADLDHMLP